MKADYADCDECGKAYISRNPKLQKFCSDACRMKDYRRRKKLAKTMQTKPPWYDDWAAHGNPPSAVHAGVQDGSRTAFGISHDYEALARELAAALEMIMNYAKVGASVTDVYTTEQPEFVCLPRAE